MINANIRTTAKRKLKNICKEEMNIDLKKMKTDCFMYIYSEALKNMTVSIKMYQIIPKRLFIHNKFLQKQFIDFKYEPNFLLNTEISWANNINCWQ